MNSRQPDTLQKTPALRKKTQTDKTKHCEASRLSQEKTAIRNKRSKAEGKNSEAEQRGFKRTAIKKESRHQETGNLSSKPGERKPKKLSCHKNKIMTTETNERSLDLTESSIQGNGILQEALKSTKFVEAKYLEVLNRMQDMKRREKKLDDTRVKQLELAVDRLTKENGHLKYQLSNIQETIQEKRDFSDSKKTKESAEVLNSLRRFEAKEREMEEKIKKLEEIVKPQSTQSQTVIKRDYGSHSKTTVDKIHGSVHNRSSINTNKTRSDRSPSPGNLKRLLNQAASQLLNDPVVGRRKSSSRLLNPDKTATFRNEASGNLASFKQQTPQREKTEYMIENMERAVMKMAKECNYLRKDSREVYSKLQNIEKVLEK